MKNFRIIIPRVVDTFLSLVEDIIEKHVMDGTESKLSSLEMDTMQAMYAQASVLHTEAKQLERDREKAVELRNHALGIEPEQNSFTPDTVLYYLSSIRDNLSGVFKGRERNMGDWGFDVNSGSKGKAVVIIPQKPVPMVALAKKILDKHTKDGSDSPLSGFDMDKFADLVAEAELQESLAGSKNKTKEKTFENRDMLLGFGSGQRRITRGTLLHFVTSSRDILKGHYRGFEQTLGDWGFEVNTYLPPNPPDPEPETASVSGMVINQSTAQPIGGVQVVFASSAGNTVFSTNTLGSFNGVVEISGEETVTVEITHAGYLSYSGTYAFTPGQSYELSFVLTPVIAPQ